MLKLVVGVIIGLHGLVHLLYLGQSARYFELQPGLTWPDGAWALRWILNAETVRWLAGAACVAAAVGFAAGGAGVLLGQQWWRPVTVGAAVLSAALYALFWNGTLQRLDQQGAIGVLISAVVLAAALLAPRLQVDFLPA